ncbi:MAG: type III pantothenate kinase [Candidatus Pedobacter colombiensis]|uniref:Type III pantothenate kinase n=1 Tax=Candidatus Pedobacter colombiensis TaxID=3121371 RepID=A0AAJ5WBA0_9SPHI|nr:type III pantothenate kinase [Pedobacter sp.]WEK19617.1 MAG: type III pantothenate kinase [Pedobacter sp.]
MHNLVIDIGNTNSKLAVFDEKTLVNYQVLKQIVPAELINVIKQYHIVNSSISSVSADLLDVIHVLESNTNYIPFSTSINTGIKNNYQTLSTLGLDRWAKVIAANSCYPGQNCLMIDSGTCITYDLLNSKSEYFGGSISPGIDMRFKALHHFTGRLPLVKWDQEADIPKGIDTNSAIKNGVLQGVINEVEGFISSYNKENKGLTVLLTGGNAAFLLEQLKNSIFAPQIIHDPYLVLKGLNEVIAFEYVQKN